MRNHIVLYNIHGSMKTIISVFLLLLSSCVFSQENREVIADSLVANAIAQLGVPYKWATSNPNVSFDCSGFASYVYGSVNVPNSRSSSAYATLGKEIALEQCQKGDCLVFAGTTPGSKTPGHVGIVVSNTKAGLQFIHCSSSSSHFGVVLTDYYSSNYPERFLMVRRLF